MGGGGAHSGARAGAEGAGGCPGRPRSVGNRRGPGAAQSSPPAPPARRSFPTRPSSREPSVCLLLLLLLPAAALSGSRVTVSSVSCGSFHLCSLNTSAAPPAAQHHPHHAGRETEASWGPTACSRLSPRLGKPWMGRGGRRRAGERHPAWHTPSLSSPHIPIANRAPPSRLPNVCQTPHGLAWAGEPWVCQRCQALGGVPSGQGRAGGLRAAGSPGQGRSGSPTPPGLGLAPCSVPLRRGHPHICKGGQGTVRAPPSVTPLPGRSAGDTGLSACPRSSCCSPGPFSSPVNFCVRLPAVQLRNVLPFALASAEVMFSAELSRALSGEGPRPEGLGDLAPPLRPSSSLLAPSRCQHSMSSSVWRGMGLDAALVQ